MPRRLLAVLLFVTAPAVADPVDDALRRARMSHEPDAAIREAVRLLDERLDADARDAESWRRLGEALAIGFARSRHARSPLDAWRHALEVAPTNCHLAALVAREELGDGNASPTLDGWRQKPDACPEILVLAARVDAGAAIDLLERARAAGPTAEGLVALGEARLVRGELRAAEAAYTAALAAPALFPEDWRVDGWTAVHANLGLAVIYARTHRAARARAARKAMHSYWDDPGPWHDLSDAEKLRARRFLGERLP